MDIIQNLAEGESDGRLSSSSHSIEPVILVSPVSAAQATRSAKIFSLVFAVQERRPGSDFILYAACFA